MKFGDRQNEVDRVIIIGVMHEPTENPVTGDPSKLVKLETQLESNDDAKDSITIQGISQDAEDSILIQDAED